MMKMFGFAAVTASALALSACSRAEAEPKPDPRAVEALVERLEAGGAPAEVVEKVAKADRMIVAVDRSDPDRLAGAAERLLAP
jgi:phosphoglycolate phosphatase-like HAD superfamily hydrolase